MLECCLLQWPVDHVSESNESVAGIFLSYSIFSGAAGRDAGLGKDGCPPLLPWLSLSWTQAPSHVLLTPASCLQDGAMQRGDGNRNLLAIII